MFSDDQLTAIFGNIEHIYDFASKLLADLKATVTCPDDLYGTCIGDVFLMHVRTHQTRTASDVKRASVYRGYSIYYNVSVRSIVFIALFLLSGTERRVRGVLGLL